MATSARYFDLVREMKDAYNHGLRLVESAKRIGIKPTGCREELLSFSRNGERKLSVGHVWNALRKMPPDREDSVHRTDIPGVAYESPELREQAHSWRAFLEACQLVARVRGSKTSATYPTFDLSLLTPESFS